MCGIAGLVGSLDFRCTANVERMLDAMVHRGPDQDGLWASSGSGSGVILGHRRLSILDISEAGRQPMVHPASGTALTFNGECYNYAEIRSELEALGYCFVSRSDTEVVLAAFVEWGEEAIGRLRGMFALACYDPFSDTLLIVRDRLGIKPLYYTSQSGHFLFASELRALLTLDYLPRRIDPMALDSYLWHGFVLGPRTMVRDVHLLEGGVALRVASNGEILRQHRYWQIPPSKVGVDQVLAVREAEAELEKAVRLHLVSDVPLGVFLSGGVDSSVVAALAQRSSSRPIKTFNLRFNEEKYDESRFATSVANALRTDHHEFLLTEQQFRNQLDDAIGSLDQPTFDAINTYFISRAVREAGLTVALSGAGGDELFGGYASFTNLPRMMHIGKLAVGIPDPVRALVGRLVCKLVMGQGPEVPPQTRWGKLYYALSTRGNIVGLYQVWCAMFTRELQEALRQGSELSLKWGLYPGVYQNLRDQTDSEEDLLAISRLELTSFVGERLLRDTDTTSMASSLEVRVPLLDHVFIESISKVSIENRFLPIRKKDFLIRMMGRQLPVEIFNRPKAAFELPLEKWCRTTLLKEVEGTLTNKIIADLIGLESETIGRIWRAFKRHDPGIHWSRVWSLFVLMNWCERNNVYL